jgi:NDP-sugar pyrophosphorylase family protein
MSAFAGIILAGGRGERLTDIRSASGRDGRLPKPLVNINETPMVENNVLLKKDVFGFLKVHPVIIAAGVNSQNFQRWLSQYEHKGRIIIDDRKFPGSAQAVVEATRLVNPMIGYVVTSGDEIAERFNLDSFLKTVEESRFKATLAIQLSSGLGRNRVIHKDGARIVSTCLEPKGYKAKDIGYISLGILAIKRGYEDFIKYTEGENWDGMLLPFIAQGLLGVHVVSGVCFHNVNYASDHQRASRALNN